MTFDSELFVQQTVNGLYVGGPLLVLGLILGLVAWIKGRGRQ